MPIRFPRLVKAAVLLAAVFPLLAFAAGGSGSAAAPAAFRPIRVEFFFQPGCSECARVKEEVLPDLQVRYEGFYALEMLDIGIKDNYLRLAGYQEALRMPANTPVSMVLDGRHALNGFEEIRDGLFPLLDRLAQEQLSGAAPANSPPAQPPPPAADPLRERARRFTLIGIVTAGLVDGINPCAISTLVFFISLLSVLKVSGRRLLVVGLSFMAASFATYTAIGFGLMRFIHLFSGYSLLRTAINVFMIGLLAVFAFLSFLDAWRYHKSGKASDVTLQLPEKVKLRIHKIMRGGLGAGSLVMGSLFIGSSVTVLESVCTGQVYLPTLVMLIKSGGADVRSWLYLLLYNLMFQVPIIVVFIFTLQGMKTARLMSLSKKGVVWSKVALGLFFIAMAALIIFL